jgi:membrane-bound serine protease (ClpP class)
MEDLLIFSLGFALLLIELLLIPGFGVVGFLGILFMLLGLLSAMVEHYPGTPWYQPDWEQVSGRFVVLMFSLAGTVVLAGLLARWLPHTRFGSRLVLTRQAARKEGYASTVEHPELVGQTGTCLTDLHPSGMARINGHRISVISRGDFIAKGSMVRVSEHHGSRIIVDPAPTPSPEDS